MAVRRSFNFLNQMRVDVPHMRSIESAVRSDFDELISSYVIGQENSYIIRGFEINMVGAIGSSASSLQMLVANSAVFHGKSNESGTFFQILDGTPNQSLNATTNTKVQGSFTPSALNYVGLELVRQIDNSTAAQIFLWNPTNKTEISRTAPLAETFDYRIVISSSLWASNVLPISIVETDASNNVVSVEDRRPMLFRLGTAGSSTPNPFYSYPWDHHPEGREENFWKSTTSTSPFRGGDKQIETEKEWKDAIMSILTEIKGTTFWYSPNAGSIVNIRADLAQLQVTGSGTISHSDATPGLITWDEDFHLTFVGSRLKYTIKANPEPSTDLILADDQVAYINVVRGVDIIPNLILTNGSPIVNSVGAVAWTADILAGDYVKVGSESDSKYYKVLSIDSLSQVTLTENYADTSTGSGGIQAKYAYGFYEVNASPSTDRHVYVADRKDVPFTENVYWLILRQDDGGSVAKAYLRGITGGELEQGEDRQISDNTTLEVLQYIGSSGEADANPNYVDALVTSVAEVTTITFPAASDLSSGESFNLNAANDLTEYYFYAIIDGSGSGPSIPGKIGVKVDLLSTDTDIQVAGKYHAAINAISDFNSVDNSDGTVTATNAAVGATTDASNNDMGGAFAVNVDVQGAGAANYVVVDDENLTRAIKRLDQELAQISSSLGSNTWKSPVADFASLPISGNAEGDVRLVLDTRVAYHWDASQALWLPLTGNNGVKVIGGGTISNTTASGSVLQQNSVFADTVTSLATLDTDLYGFWFVASSNVTISDVLFKVDRSNFGGSNPITAKAYIYNESGGEPNAIIGTSDTLVTAALAGDVQTDITLNFSGGVNLTSGQTYFVLLTAETNAGAVVRVYGDGATLGDSQNLSGNVDSSDGGANWTVGALTSGIDPYFILNGSSGNQVSFTEDMYLELKGLQYSYNTIPTSESPIVFTNDQDVAYVEPNLIAPGGNLTIVVDTLDNVPKSAVIVARRDGDDVIVGSSSTRVAVGESIKLYDSKTDQDKDKMRGADYGFFRSADAVVWTGTEFQFTSDIVFETVNREGTVQTYTVESSDSPIAIADGEYVYLLIDRTQNSQILSFSVNSSLPAIPAAGQDLIVFAKRVDAAGISYLHLPLSKQLMDEGQASKLGASGSGGSGLVKVKYLDPISTTLPTGTSVTIDGQSGVNGDYVLFSNLVTGNNRVYELSGVGVAIAWTEVRSFNGQFDPEDGDAAIVQSGDSFREQIAIFDGTNFKVNDTMRFFDGVSADFWELSSIKTTTLSNNTTGNVFTVNASGSENMIISYSIIRSGNKETGDLYLTSDGTNVSVARAGANLSDVGIEFSAQIVSGDLELNYDSNDLGVDGTLKYFVKRWSDSIGGPTGIPSYSGSGGGSTVEAAGNVQEVQFNGSGGNLDADARFKWDATEGGLSLNGLISSALKPPVTLNDGQLLPLMVISYPAATYNACIVKYSIERNGERRTGRILVANGSSGTPAQSDDYVETNPLGITFSAQINGANLEIRYISTATGNTATLKYSIEKW